MSNTTPAPPSHSNNLEIEKEKDKLDARTLAEVNTGGIFNSLLIVHKAGDDLSKVGATEGAAAMKEHAKAVHRGDMRRVETMLISQATALDSLFASMALRAQNVMGKDQLHVMQAYMKLGLKAQSQCRTTLETLANIKNPRPYIQNNKAQYQQVNNGTAVEGKDQYAQAHTHAEENQKSSNELLDDTRHEQQWMDIGTPQASSRTHKELATVAK